MLESVLVPNNALGNWAGQLIDALESEVISSGKRFLTCLEGLLDRADDAGANLDEFQRMITALRDKVSRCRTSDVAEIHRLEPLWHAARLAVASAALRGVGRQRNEMQHSTSTLGRSGERFATTMSVPLLKQALLEELPALHIDQAAVSLFEAGFGSRLVPLLVLKDRHEVTVEEKTCAPESLAPDAVFESDTCFNSVVVPLTFEAEMLGIALFSAKATPSVYGVLRQQIGSAIQVASLHRRSVAQIEARERLEQSRISAEASVAAEIQTSMNPVLLEVPGLEIAHVMLPAAEAGGDYYDVLPDDTGTWLTIGDVAGHGLGAGLIMLMLQSVIAGLVRNDKNILPSQLVSVVNEVIYDNVRHRLRRDEHATLTALRCERSGRVIRAGAHDPVIVYRADTRRCEVIETPGIWVGMLPDARMHMEDFSFQLHDKDVMLLYTDGVTEARNTHHEQFGLERLVAFIESAGTNEVSDIRDGVLLAVRSWSTTLDDDVTVVVVRFHA